MYIIPLIITTEGRTRGINNNDNKFLYLEAAGGRNSGLASSGLRQEDWEPSRLKSLGKKFFIFVLKNELGGGPKDFLLTTSGFNTNLPATKGMNTGGGTKGLCHQLSGGRTEGVVQRVCATS